jgi:4-hydroxybenzoate polyprenyltransferase
MGTGIIIPASPQDKCMKLIRAFFKLIRWPNLVFIILTQLLFYFCVFQPLYGSNDLRTLVWLISASVLIAAAGYIINDYFDLNIDQINKPQENVFVRSVNRRWAILWHFLFSFMGILATALAVGLTKWYLIAANIFVVLLLWFYSTSFKKQLLIGNIVISILTAWTVLILFFAFTTPYDALGSGGDTAVKFFRVAFLYAGFAFVISLIREAIKDMQDIEGDARYGCKTLPIVSGVRTTKIYTIVWLVVLLGSMIILQLYVLMFKWWLAVIYNSIFIIVPLVYVLFKLSKAQSSNDFAFLSRLTKFIMFTGIASMIFFRIYFNYG